MCQFLVHTTCTCTWKHAHSKYLNKFSNTCTHIQKHYKDHGPVNTLFGEPTAEKRHFLLKLKNQVYSATFRHDTSLSNFPRHADNVTCTTSQMENGQIPVCWRGEGWGC